MNPVANLQDRLHRVTLAATQELSSVREQVWSVDCAAAEDWRGAMHLFLGPTGSGKTTLSSGPGLKRVSDGMHLWSSAGIASIGNEKKSTHPSTIVFLIADTHGVLPPIAKLPVQQAMIWFLLEYSSKPAAFFQHFLSDHHPEMYLVNTGWLGGPAGIGRRMDIILTRRLVDAALWGQLKDVPHREDRLFHLLVPRECPGVDPRILDPKMLWGDQKQYEECAKALADELGKKFDLLCTGEMLEGLREKCPGR